MKKNQHVPLPQSLLTPYTGGHTVEYGGYLYELCPEHPKANPFGFVKQHRLVVERDLGRLLRRSEHVHHRDEDKTNNALSNLQVVSKAEHMAIHQKLRRLAKYPPLTKKIVREALADGGLKAAARALGVSMNTIRRQFPDLVEPYKRTSPHKLDNPQWVEKLRKLAADDSYGYREAAAEMGMSPESVAHILKRNDIPWVRKSKKGEIHTKYTFRNRKPSQQK